MAIFFNISRSIDFFNYFDNFYDELCVFDHYIKYFMNIDFFAQTAECSIAL